MDYLITKKTQQKTHYDKRHRALHPDYLETRQDILFISPADQTAYLEGTIVGKAQSLRSYIIEVKDHRYRCNRQHIFPINTNIKSPFSGPCINTTPQTNTNTYISGPSHITRPPSPPKILEVIQSEKILKSAPQPLALHKNNATHLTNNVRTPDHPLTNHLILSLVPFQDLCHE